VRTFLDLTGNRQSPADGRIRHAKAAVQSEDAIEDAVGLRLEVVVSRCHRG